MAISVDWGTRVISVAKADLAPLGGGVYQLDLNAFRLALKDLEDGPEGMAAPDTHRHNTEVTLGGVTLARQVEIVNGYTVTFEDGVYAVSCVGANSNIADVLNLNSVSVRTANSAGLIVVAGGSGLSQAEHDKLMAIPSATLQADERAALLAVEANVDAVDASVGAVGAAVANVDADVAALAGALAAVDAVVDAIKLKTDALPGNVARARALAHFHVLMVRSSDHRTPATGLAVSAQIAKDAGAFAAIAGAVSEVGSGVYDVAGLTAEETDCSSGTLLLTAAGADPRYVSFVTSP